MQSLARLSLLKSKLYLDMTSATKGDDYDDVLKAVLVSVTGAVNNWLGRNLCLETHEHIYNGAGTDKLFLRNVPIVMVDSVKIWDGTEWDTQTATWYEIEDEYLYYPAHGVTDSDYGEWPEGTNNILVKYTAGYPCANFDNVVISDVWHVPADLEDAVCKIAALKWKEKDRLGILSGSRAGDSTSYEKYVQGWPADVLAVLHQYRRGL